MNITNFQIFRNKFKKPDTQQPDYKISSKDEAGKFIEIGAGWKKTMSNGDTYISCKMTETPYVPKNSQPQATEGLTEDENKRIKELKAQELARQAEIKDPFVEW